VGLLRLWKCGRNTTCPELKGMCSIVRELHVYGTVVPVHGRDADKLQHQVCSFGRPGYPCPFFSSYVDSCLVSDL